MYVKRCFSLQIIIIIISTTIYDLISREQIYLFNKQKINKEYEPDGWGFIWSLFSSSDLNRSFVLMDFVIWRARVNFYESFSIIQIMELCVLWMIHYIFLLFKYQVHFRCIDNLYTLKIHNVIHDLNLYYIFTSLLTYKYLYNYQCDMIVMKLILSVHLIYSFSNSN